MATIFTLPPPLRDKCFGQEMSPVHKPSTSLTSIRLSYRSPLHRQRNSRHSVLLALRRWTIPIPRISRSSAVRTPATPAHSVRDAGGKPVLESWLRIASHRLPLPRRP